MLKPPRKQGPESIQWMCFLCLKPALLTILVPFLLLFVYRILVSGIGCYFMLLSHSNFNPVAKNSSNELELFAALQKCRHLINLSGENIFIDVVSPSFLYLDFLLLSISIVRVISVGGHLEEKTLFYIMTWSCRLRFTFNVKNNETLC